MNLGKFTKFGMINRTMEVSVCLFENYAKLLMECVSLVKRSIGASLLGS